MPLRALRPARTTLTALLASAAFAAPVMAQEAPDLPQAEDSYYQAARQMLAERLLLLPNTSQAKNVILFVGDGFGVSTITAARIYQGQQEGVDGESYVTTMDFLPYSALVKTYTSDSQIADSAPTATALTTGVKTSNGVVGVDQTVPAGDCEASQGHAPMTLWEQAEAAGKATGVVSTARITHATPAATYAHVADRDWESDADMSDEAKAAGCLDIAAQLIEWPYGDGFEVILGGGRAAFLTQDQFDPEDEEESGDRLDGRDLTAEWTAGGADRVYVWNQDQFDAADPAGTGQLFGLFEPSHMKYEFERPDDAGGEPSLAEMTRKAIEMLQKDDDGFVLMIEAGRIDHAHHGGMAGAALEEARMMDEAVSTALSMTDPAETLYVTTADHSHGLVINGYAARGNPILGLSADADGEPATGSDGLPYTTLTYAGGPGAADGPRADLSDVDVEALDYQQQALIPMGSAPHAGEDVAVRAAGPWAHLFSGTIEQNFIYHVMAYALGFEEPGETGEAME